MIDFDRYITQLQSVEIEDLTEYSKRSALEILLNQAATMYMHTSMDASEVIVLQEPKRIENYGSPDFKIYTKNAIIGYVENKKINQNLDNILKSEQIIKYCELSKNILITNYIEFIWIKEEIIERQTLCYLTDIENKKFKVDKDNAKKVEKLLLNFFSQTPVQITDSKDLAVALAIRCKNLKDFICDELNRQVDFNETERLYNLYKAFKINVFKELSISEFSDAYAQMLIYSFFLAGLNADPQMITTDTAKKYIPTTFQLIKELVAFLDELEKTEYKETKWIIDETVFIINNINWQALKQSLSFDKKSDSETPTDFETDPYIYFYETFLSTYDYELRKAKGVYYTPPQVVNFIVRATDEVLKNIFNLSNGLADSENVTVLDFATGTGTFLLEIFKLVLKDNLLNQNALIKNHLLKNIYGFEYLIAPYAVAHLKLSQFLKEKKYLFQEKERLQVYLTNTLEPVENQMQLDFLPQLFRETQAAQKIKDAPILVITGNPPYSAVSKNNGTWILNQIKKYQTVDGLPLNERKHWLNDDYVKFMRFAHQKMEKVEQGIVAIITNHSFLDNPTFRGMRQSLLNTFDQLYFIDLHGNASKKETTIEGEKDENVFDIKQGVAISILVKKKGLDKKVFHSHFYGLRKDKLTKCLDNSLSTIDFKEVKPNSPFYFFIPKDEKDRKEYENGWKIDDIFNFNVSGIVTSKDNLCINFNENDLHKAIYDFKNLKISDKEIEHKYKIKSNYDWKTNEQRKKSSLNIYDKTLVKNILYHPFDIRKIYYDGDIVFRLRKKVMVNMQEKNVAILVAKQMKAGKTWQHSFITNCIVESTCVSNKTSEIGYIFPLYILRKGKEKIDFEPVEAEYFAKPKTENKFEKIENFKPDFRKFINSLFSNETVDKNIIKNLEKQISNIEKQIIFAKKSIKIYEELNTDLEFLNIQNQGLEELKSQKELKQKEVAKYNSLQNTNFVATAEQILGYIYATLYAKSYREKYVEYLKSEFPRIIFTTNLQIFKNLANLGNQLIEIHLQNKKVEDSEYAQIGNFKGDGNNIVSNINYADNKIYINQTQYFDNVSENVYNFYIGGYQIIDKYLKERKNLVILPEILQIENIIKIIAKTINLMQIIDNEIKEWI